MNTHGLYIDYGKHKGEKFTRIPVSYLKWMVNESAPSHEIAEAELKRRGTITPDIDISGHAINRASLHCRKLWHEDRGKDEGLHAWLLRVSGEALHNGKVKHDKHEWKGMKFVFEQHTKWLVLKTVMKIKMKGESSRENE